MTNNIPDYKDGYKSIENVKADALKNDTETTESNTVTAPVVSEESEDSFIAPATSDGNRVEPLPEIDPKAYGPNSVALEPADTAIEIKPLVFDKTTGTDESLYDFRAIPVNSNRPEEEEFVSPKEPLSAVEPVDLLTPEMQTELESQSETTAPVEKGDTNSKE